MSQSVNTIIRLNGVANGSGFTSQQPTAIFEHLPYAPWTALTTPAHVNGKVIGFPDPSQYQLALFAVEARGSYTGNRAWLVDIAADGTFQMQVQQAAGLYIALLMTPAFASTFFASAFPSGSGTIDRLPTPADNVGEVLLMLELPAGLNRSIVAPQLYDEFELRPGEDWVNTTGSVLPPRMLQPVNINGAPNPNQMTQDSTNALWNLMLRNMEATFCVIVQPKNPDGSIGAGAFAAGVYIYGSEMYLVAGAGPYISGSSSVAPIVVTAPLLNWGMLPPSMVQLNMTLTILPERAMLSLDVMQVEASLIYTFLKSLFKVEKKLMELMFAEI
jgi:hypothetical protein